jgi:hypothetical protein
MITPVQSVYQRPKQKELFRATCGKRITVATIRQALGTQGVTLLYRNWQGIDDLRRNLANKR